MNPKRHPPASEGPREAGARGDRMPTNAELLYELRKHGAKPPPRELPALSRRTRDYLLVVAIGGSAIGFLAFRLLGRSDPALALQLALTGGALFCGLTAYIFFSVMGRY